MAHIFRGHLARLAALGDPGVRRLTARERSTVTCASKTLRKIDKNMLNLHLVREWRTFFEEVPPGSQHSGDPGVRRITARERSTVTCASKTPRKINKNVLNLHFVREWHTYFEEIWPGSQRSVILGCVELLRANGQR